MRPTLLRPRPDAIPPELTARNQWVAWRLAYRGDKWTKIPVCPRTGTNAAVDNYATWGTFERAVAYWQSGRADGIGYVLRADDPFAAVDLDRCVVASGIETWATEIISRLATYSEISPSGTGIRILCRGSLPPGRRRKGSVEMYDSARYVTLTGHYVPDTPTTINERTTELAALHAEIFSQPQQTQRSQSDGTGLTTADDHDLIERAKTAANGVRFSRLWGGDATGYVSASEADLALVSMLAFWTGPDAERIDRLFRASALCRDKWTERADYRERTIAAALQRGDFYRPPTTRQPRPNIPQRLRRHAPNAARYGLKPAVMYIGEGTA